MAANNASTPIEGLSGDELRRSFLLTLQEHRASLNQLGDADVSLLGSLQVEQLTRDILTQDLHLVALANKIALELGIPIGY